MSFIPAGIETIDPLIRDWHKNNRLIYIGWHTNNRLVYFDSIFTLTYLSVSNPYHQRRYGAVADPRLIKKIGISGMERRGLKLIVLSAV